MSRRFERSGIAFQYPSNWLLDLDDAGDGWTVTVSSPATAFFLVSLRPDADNPAQVASEALAALKEEYTGLEAEPVVDDLAGLPAVGHEVDFLTLDTTIVCWTRCVDTVNGPLLILCQTSEYDRAQNEPVLQAICASITISKED